MEERLVVAQEVVGSTPTAHPRRIMVSGGVKCVKIKQSLEYNMEYELHEIPETVIERWGLMTPVPVQMFRKIKYRKPMRITPFTRYEILEEDGKLYVKVPITEE